MKKYFLFVVAIVAIVVMASGCTSQTGNNTTATKNYSANGISFNYPSSWAILNETSNENGTVVALGDADIQKNNTVKGNGVTIIKVPENANSTAIYHPKNTVRRTERNQQHRNNSRCNSQLNHHHNKS